VLLENRINSGGIPTVPEPFDASKVNISIAENGYVIGQKFCRKELFEFLQKKHVGNDM